MKRRRGGKEGIDKVGQCKSYQASSYRGCWVRGACRISELTQDGERGCYFLPSSLFLRRRVRLDCSSTAIETKKGKITHFGLNFVARVSLNESVVGWTQIKFAWSTRGLGRGALLRSLPKQRYPSCSLLASPGASLRLGAFRNRHTCSLFTQPCRFGSNTCHFPTLTLTLSLLTPPLAPFHLICSPISVKDIHPQLNHV